MKTIVTVCAGALLLAACATGPDTARSASAEPTMLEMTFPEFEAALARTDIILLPIGAIEEHGSYLPIGSDGMHAVGQMQAVARQLRLQGVETIVGPPLNIGITYAASDTTRPGANIYPGNLSVRPDTFVALYVDVLRSLRENGARRVFLYSGHFGLEHMQAVARIAQEASRSIDGLAVYALVPDQTIRRVSPAGVANLAPIERALDPAVIVPLLGRGAQPLVTATHADGWEISTMLHFRPDMVRPGYQTQPQSTSLDFLNGLTDRSKNPSGWGGYPTDKAGPQAGDDIVAFRTGQISAAILKVVKPGQP